MKIMTLDFETLYSKDYSLSKMQTDAYILDPRFEVILVAVKVDDEPTQWFSGDADSTGMWLAQFDFANSAVLCHNTLFDGFILEKRFGLRAKLWMDTLAMGRRLLPWLPSHSLAALAKHHGLQDKGTEVVNAIGKRRADFNPQDLQAYADYCCHDVALTHQLGKLFLPRTDALELKLIDMTVRMFTEPMFVGDQALLAKLHQGEIDRKQALLDKFGGDKSVLMSNPKMAEELRKLGVEPPMKISAKTGKEAFAFAKSDKEFTALLEHPDPEVQTLVEARLGVKTTIAETRAKMYLDMAQRGPMAIYLNYWGAKTTGRYSGGNKANAQNLSARGPSAGIRSAICAPPGHVVIAGDSSNIELRTVMVGAGQNDVVDKIASGIDLYCDFAGKIYGRGITKADKVERMLGKVAMLSLQYGAGWVKFKEMVRIQTGIVLGDAEAEKIVNLYRHVHHKVVDMWGAFSDVYIPDIASGCNLLPVDQHAWCLTSNSGFGVAAAPGVVYHGLHRANGMRNNKPELQWVYSAGRETVKIYGGKAVENWGQYVARMIVMWQTARINQNYPVKLSVHDEAVCVVKEKYAEDAKAYMEECLSLAPPWCRGHIPLACEVSYGRTYADCK